MLIKKQLHDSEAMQKMMWNGHIKSYLMPIPMHNLLQQAWKYVDKSIYNPHKTVNSSWPSATYMRRNFQCLFPQRPRYVALISVLISPVAHTWGVTNGSLLASPPNSRRSPASLISPAPHICGASRTPILTRVVWKILNVVTNILVFLPDYHLP